MELTDLGWTARLETLFGEYESRGLTPCRISFEGASNYRVLTALGEMAALPSGRLLYEAVASPGLPVVGDWVAGAVLDEDPPKAIIHAVLPRSSLFSRKAPGARTEEQHLAANIDDVFITVGLDDNFSLRRIERYLALAWSSNAAPVVVLTKADLCEDAAERVEQARDASPGVAVYAVSVPTGRGLDQLHAHLRRGCTVALLGSSGVGKSTIINYLLGAERQKVNEVRSGDSKGRHTTTSRQLFVTPSGALVIDTPGMRELQLWDADEGLSAAFGDIEQIASGCRFVDCRHENEPGCAVRAALDDGRVDPDRMENYRKMRRELKHLAIKQDASAAAAERSKWKQIHKEVRRFYKGSDKRK